MKLNTKLLTISALFIAALMLLSPISQINTSGGGGTNNYDLDFLNSLDINNNNFVLSADSSSNSVDIKDVKVVVNEGGTKELQHSGKKVDSTTTFISISDVAGLKKLSNLVNDVTTPFDFSGYTIKLTKNLTFNDPAQAGESNFTPIGKDVGVDYSYHFNGIFDGQGHAIFNLQVSGAGYAGLFGRLGPSATVKNLGIINSSISATSDSFAISGGIAGENRGTIENCYNTGDVTAKSTNKTAFSGGIAGYNTGTIKNCYNAEDVKATSTNNSAYLGGIAGLNSKTITNCYNTGDVTAKAGLLTHSGGIVGQNFVGPITNCYNTGDVTATAKSTDDNAFSGGIAGLNSGGPITNCYNTGDVTATADSINTIAYSGGIAGYNAEGAITNCYNSGVVKADSTNNIAYSGGIAGSNDGIDGTITNCYNTGDVTADSTENEAYSGGVVGKNDEDSTVQSCYSHGSSNPKLIGNNVGADGCKFFGEDGNLSDGSKLLEALNEWVTANEQNPDKYRYWMDPFIQDEKYPVFTDWYGEAERLNISLEKNSNGIYEIKNKHQLALIADDLNGSYVLSDDINLSGYEWRPIGKDDSNQFKGTFDGRGHTISNLSVNINSKSGNVYSGLFGYLESSATVKNLGIINSKISANVENVNALLGGIAGSNSGTITNCYNTGAVNSSYSSGGIAAHNDGTITNCYNTGTVNSSYSSGGIAGENRGTIENCYNTGNVTGSYSGGIVGNQGTWTTNDETITNCYNTGDVTGSYSGGIAGYNISGTITNCYNTGTVTASSNSGGIAGYNISGTITNCYNTGTVTGTGYSGGIAGYYDGGSETITNCYNTGDVTGSNSGGIIGNYNGLGTAIENCYNTGTVTGSTYSGGIIGLSNGTITNCYSTGDVTGSGTSGGIAGKNYGAIKNCYYLNGCVSNGEYEGNELDQDAMTGSNLLSGDNNLNKDKDSNDITDPKLKPWSLDIFGVNGGYPILADVPTQIDPKNSANTPPQSAVYVTLGIEKDQAENYLKPFILTNGNEVDATINCLNDQAEKITSYQWYTMNDKGVFIEVDETPSPEIQETYYVKVTINGYSYTSLTRTVSDSFIVMFDNNGGSDVKSIIVSNGKSISQPENQTKTGYTFEGWYTSADKKWDFSSDKVTNNMTLYAVWTPIPEPIYTLCLNSNDLTLQTKRYSGTYGTEVTLKSASDFGWNDECKFIEWNSKSDGSGVSYKEGDKFSLGSETWNLYAIWSDSSYHTVSFDSNGGNSIPSQSIQDGYRASEPNAPTKQGHSFKYWSLNGTKYDFNQSVKEDITLKAEYEVISYKVTFYYNGEIYYSTVADYNTSLGDRMPSLPSDKDSWNTSENGKGSNFTSDSLITSDISIYAVSENSITSILIIGGSAAVILALIAAWMFMRSRYN